MDEIGFVIKSFLVSAFVVFLMQMKVSGERSIEAIVVGYMHNAWATKWMKDMGGGAVRATASVYDKTIGDVVKHHKTTLGKITDIKGEMKAAQEAGEAREKRLLDIENQ